MVITVPLLFIISAIEAVIVRAALKPGIRGSRLVMALFIINAITSTIGIFTMPNGTELIPGIPYAFLATTILEAFCLPVIFPKGKRRLSLDIFKTSALMNGASYLFLGLLLAALIYLPSMRMQNDLNKAELTGKFVVLDYHNKPTAFIALPSGKLTLQVPAVVDMPLEKYKVAHTGKERWVVEKSTGKRIGKIQSGAYNGAWQVSSNGRYYTNNLSDSDTVVVGDILKGTCKSFPNIDEVVMYAKTGKVALVKDANMMIYEPASGAVKVLKLEGMLQYYRTITWSPDGKYVAHFADISPFTQAVGERYPNAIRVVSLTGKSITFIKELPYSVKHGDLLWLR
jgi:hypothetical protein